MSFRNIFFFNFFAIIFIVLVGCDTKAVENPTVDSSSNLSTGEVLKIAMDGQPPTLDQPTAAATVTRDIARLIFETLMTVDSNYKPVPMLAESVNTEDNKTYTFHLRKGIKFHNGKEMIAEDVIASMERWMEKSAITGSVFNDASWEAKDDYTVVLKLKESSPLVLDTIASPKQAAAIMPKDVIDEATSEGVNEYVGTGPYKFIEWKQDQYIHLERYTDYQSLDSDSDGLSGKKEALVNDIYFYFVPDSATRLTGLQTEEYDFAYSIPYDNYEQLDNDPNIQVYLSISGVQLLAYNKVKGLAADQKMRQVINTALNVEEIMEAAFPNEDLYSLHSSYMDEEIVNWRSEAGNKYHNINDPEKAKEMLAELNYTGEEFRILTTRDYEHHYNVAVVIQDQLKNIGINAMLEVYDWPTVTQLKDDTDVWDAYVISFSPVSTPLQFLGLSPTWAGGVNDDYIDEMMRKIETAPTIEEAQEIWKDLQLYVWEDHLPVTVFGSFHSLYAANNKVEGFTAFAGPIFWNTSVKEQ